MNKQTKIHISNDHPESHLLMRWCYKPVINLF